MSWASTEGTPSPLGVTWVEEDHAYNFALYSKHAWGVTLLLFAEDDVVTPLFHYDLNHLRNKSGFVWHCRVRTDRADAARYYAYRVSGPPPAVATEWHRFDSDKILLDPYATSVFFLSRSIAMPLRNREAPPERRLSAISVLPNPASTGRAIAGPSTSRIR